MTIKIDRRLFYFMFVILSFFPPNMLKFVAVGSRLSSLLLLFRLTIAVIYIIKVNLKYKNNLLDYLVILLLSSQIVSAIMTNSFYWTYLSGQISLLGLYSFMKFQFKENYGRTLLRAFNITFFIYIVIQIVTQQLFPYGFDILNPFGDNREYFLGRKNIITPYLIVSLNTYYLGMKKMDRFISLKEVFVTILMAIISYFSFSSTAFICYLIFILFRYVSSIFKLDKHFVRLIFILYSVISISILFLQNTWVKLFVGLFGKDLTFSGRTNIWSQAIQVFQENRIFGYGLNLVFVPWTNGIVVSTAHNLLLDLLSRYGIITGAIFFCIILYFFLGKMKFSNFATLASFVCYLFLILTESISLMFFVCLAAILFYYTEQEEKIETV